MAREAIWRGIVAAHKAGEIDLAEMSLSHVAAYFECSTHTAGLARKALGIVIEKRPFYRPFQGDEEWNEERRDYLEHWPR